MSEQQLKMARMMLELPDTTVKQVAEHFGIARSTLYRLLEKQVTLG